jgi:DNA-binding transcriptional MocR family regulator
MFSPRRAFRHCIRLNYGMRWSQSLDAAMATLGRLIASSR